ATQRPPSLTAVTPQLTPRSVGGVRARLTLDGVALKGDSTAVQFDELAPVIPVSVTESQVTVDVPDPLRSGIHRIRALVTQRFDSAGVVRSFPLESNLLPFVLEPRITTASPLAASVGGMVTIDVDPPIRPRQDVRLIV